MQISIKYGTNTEQIQENTIKYTKTKGSGQDMANTPLCSITLRSNKNNYLLFNYFV